MGGDFSLKWTEVHGSGTEMLLVNFTDMLLVNFTDMLLVNFT